MKRPILVRFRRTGFTLVEILVATTLALLLMGAVAVMFGRVAESITDSRSMLEAADRLRLAETRLQMDLAGITATVSPPLKPENNEGYFEYIEGPALAVMSPTTIAKNSDNGDADDRTVGDFDDILMFTTRTAGKPFVGRYYNPVTSQLETIQSDVAEVAWFLRGRTLHRRVLLVAPNVILPAVATGYYNDYDISARWDSGLGRLRANTLGDLTRRECRFAHINSSFPYGIPWTWTNGSYTFSTLPTLNECSYSGLTGLYPSPPYTLPVSNLDFWTNVANHRLDDNAFIGGGTNLGQRVSDDVILTNVIGFDVKVFDPDRGDYVDLRNAGPGRFSGDGVRVNRTDTTSSAFLAGVYDTWSTHYESVGRQVGDTFAGRSINGIDDLGNNPDGTAVTGVGADILGVGVVDDDSERITSPPYPYPLRGIQVKIRVFEPDSRQIREVTVVQDFLPR